MPKHTKLLILLFIVLGLLFFIPIPSYTPPTYCVDFGPCGGLTFEPSLFFRLTRPARQSATQREVSITSPLRNSTITSPITISGFVPKSWTFEGNIFVEIQNGQHIPLASTPVYVKFHGEADERPAFSVILTFSPNTSAGFIVIKADNPSGLPQNSKSFSLPIRFK